MRCATVLAGLLCTLAPCFPTSAPVHGSASVPSPAAKRGSATPALLVAETNSPAAEPVVSNRPEPEVSGASREVEVPASCLVALPSGECPQGGWPVFVLMHGYRTNKEDFDALAKVVAAHGAIAICVDAPNELGEGRRSWDASIESTHAYLQEQIGPLRSDPRFDFDPIHVGGFSQGGIRSLLLIVNYESVYGGALSVSPAEGTWPATPPKASRSHPMRLVYGTGESPRMITNAEQSIAFWAKWEQPYGSFTHPAGHQFPSDWAKVLGEGVDWILAESARE